MNKYKQYVTEEMIDAFQSVERFSSCVNENFKLIMEGNFNEELKQFLRTLIGTGIESCGEREIVFVGNFKDYLTTMNYVMMKKCAQAIGLKMNNQMFKKNNESKIMVQFIKQTYVPSVKKLPDVIMQRRSDTIQNWMKEHPNWQDRNFILANWHSMPFNDKYVKIFKSIGTEQEVRDALKIVEFYFHAVGCPDNEDILNKIHNLMLPIDYDMYEISMAENLTFFMVAEEKRKNRDVELKNRKLSEKLHQTEQSASQQLDEAMHLLKEKDEEFQKLLVENAILKERIQQYEKLLDRKVDSQADFFENKRVLVVGHPVQKEKYEEEIVVRGGIFEFMPAVTQEVGFDALKGAVARADVVLYISTYTSHTVGKIIASNIKEKAEFHTITCKGRTTFASELERLYNEKQSKQAI